ncbi:uncharacterized protein G2W53_011710 [Senna tora]|uniref:Uncharacterized protein n=1 Tax=Senna tora TaxID=362788 RepID=A0A835CCP9_9FABA|nr:uncharacterized protein G2W53_011710 [Senna tora]
MGEEKNTGKREMGFLLTARTNGGDGGSGYYCERMACCGRAMDRQRKKGGEGRKRWWLDGGVNRKCRR